VRASMGSVFPRPPVQARLDDLRGTRVALEGGAEASLAEVAPTPPVVICIGAEREGLPAEISDVADASARIPMLPGGPDSLNVAIAAAIAMHELRTRMAAHA
jgi:tRNA G18 (ribose-2'-O)-methylase SpoU